MWHNHISVLKNTKHIVNFPWSRHIWRVSGTWNTVPAFPLLQWKQAVSLCFQTKAEQELWHSNGLLLQPHGLMWMCQKKKKKGEREDLERFQNYAHYFPSPFELWPETPNTKSYNFYFLCFGSDCTKLGYCPQNTWSLKWCLWIHVFFSFVYIFYKYKDRKCSLNSVN